MRLIEKDLHTGEPGQALTDDFSMSGFFAPATAISACDPMVSEW